MQQPTDRLSPPPMVAVVSTARVVVAAVDYCAAEVLGPAVGDGVGLAVGDGVGLGLPSILPLIHAPPHVAVHWDSDLLQKADPWQPCVTSQVQQPPDDPLSPPPTMVVVSTARGVGGWGHCRGLGGRGDSGWLLRRGGARSGGGRLAREHASHGGKVAVEAQRRDGDPRARVVIADGGARNHVRRHRQGRPAPKTSSRT